MKRNKLLLFVFLFSFTGLAFAGGSLSSILTIGVAIGGMFLGVPPVWILAATFATSVITSAVFSSNNNQSVNSGSIGSTNARQQVPPDTTTPIPVVYGDCFLGGKFVDACLTIDQTVMYYVMAISCISENGTFTYDLNNMYYGDRLITFDTIDPARVTTLTDTAGNIDYGIFNNLFIHLYTSDKNGNITCHNGTDLPWASVSTVMGPTSGLIASQQWTSTGRRMNGLAFAIIRLTYNTAQQTTSLQPTTFRVQQNLYAHSYAQPGDVLLDYLTNPIYGGAVPSEFVDLDGLAVLQSYSNELITFNDYNGNPQTQPRYRINGVIDPSQGCLQNVDQIMTACDSWLKYDAKNGKWSVVVNQATSTTYDFNDSNLVGAITVGTIDIAQMPNQIEARFPDGTNRDQYNYVNESVPDSLLLPNEPVNKLSVNYDLVNNSVQALYLANRVLEQSREDLLVTINTTYDGIQVNAGDVVTITNSSYGWSFKPFRAMQVKESITPEGILGAQIQLIEYNPSVYDNADITQFNPSSNGNLVNPSTFSSLSPANPVNIYPYASVPSFDINVAIPNIGRVTYVILYYTTVASPLTSDWQQLDKQTLSSGQAYPNGSTLTFLHYTIPANTYYFAYVVGNEIAQSQLSPISSAFNWAPDPANANSFVSTLSPSTLSIPYNGTPVFTGISFKLYGSNGLGPVDYVPATSDSDASFIAGTWRIGYNATTGYATDIVQTGITFPLPPTDGGSYALFGAPTAMTANPATVQIPVRYKDLAGNVHLIPTSTMQVVYAIQGNTGTKSAYPALYQWNISTPPNPSGTTLYDWASGTQSGYTGSGGWDTTIPSNPGIAGLKLYQALNFIYAANSITTSTVDWSTGYTISDITQNGAAGLQSAQPTVFQWAITIPAGPTGSSTYTWATSSFAPTPSGWSLDAGTSPSPGYTLWGATVQITDSATVTTTNINWTLASITARGYAGTTGSAGTAGASSRICYSATSLSSLANTPTTYTTSGSSSFPPNGEWGSDTVWQATPPTITAGQSVYQSDGIYSPTSGNTVWNVPYLSNLKVGSLSAITANMGTLTSGTIIGGTIETSSSGARVVMDATNTISTYNSSGTLTTQIGGTSGCLYVQSYTAVTPAGAFISTSSSTPAAYATNNTKNGFEGYSLSTGFGVLGQASIFGGTNHGVGGKNTASTGGTSTSGIVGTSIGYDFYADGAGTNYGPFTGAHDVLVPIGLNIPIGYIVCDVKMIIAKNISNTVFEVTESSSANQVPIGVMVVNNGSLANTIPASFVENSTWEEVDGSWVETKHLYPEYDANKDLYDYCAANAVGEGQIYICGEGGDIAAGDLIVTSSTSGLGMKQSDNIVQNITVAKARQAVTFTDTTTPVLVACIYLCG